MTEVRYAPRGDDPQSASPRRSFATLYGSAIVLAAIALLFSGATNFAFTRGLVPYPPLVPVLAIAGCTVPLLVGQGAICEIVRSRVLKWALADVLLASISFTWSSQSDVAVQALRFRFLAAGFIGAMTVLFSDDIVQRNAQRAIIVSTCISITLCILEFFRPGTFSDVFGRSAALYLNPNIAATAILVGMIVALETVPGSVRPAFVLASGLGVFLTTSRGGILCWVVMVIAFLFQKRLRPRRFFGGSLLLFAVAVPLFVLSGQGERIESAMAVIESRSASFERVLDAEDVLEHGDVSTEERAAVAKHALEMFLSRPFTGYGIGATLEWEDRVSTHNMYLRYGAEEGVFGALCYLGLVVAFVWRLDGSGRAMGVSMALFLIVQGFFSHNLVEEWDMLIGLALCSSMISRRGSPERTTRPSPGAVPVSDGHWNADVAISNRR